MSRPLFAVVPAALLCGLVFAVPPEAASEKSKAVSADARQAAGRATVEPGLMVDAWAGEPLLANPVSFAFDEHGKCYVAETYRHSDGVSDTRSHMYWLDDDIGCRTVADRVAMYTKHKFPAYEKFGEQLRVVWDSTKSGHADKSEVFAGPYNRPQDGLAAGVLARKGSVYLACIPDLYKLTDTKGMNKADKTESLATGFGIHVQFLGHDLHGLRMGPDGKLYMSIGDRGLNVTTKEGKHLFYPDTGCVLRCDPDGANLEVVHSGLRNPQELAFDDHGNLFTYDNNSDSGDQARWVYVVPGGDSGWRCGFQYGTLLHSPAVPQGNRGPWNTEKIWVENGADVPAYVVPALKNFGNGPSGITHYPGVGLGDRYANHFFACDFTANPGGSKIWSLGVKPKGAGFEVTDLHPFVQNMLPTDCEFGPDGAFYWLDWVGGWNKPAKGRIFRVTDPTAMKNPAVADAQKLLAAGFARTSDAGLAKLLEHPHQNVRLEAQYELANGTRDAVPVLVGVAANSKNPPARLHAVWGLGMLAGKPGVSDALVKLATDADAEVRAQVAKMFAKVPAPLAVVLKLLADPEPRVKASAAIAVASATVAEALRSTPAGEQAKLAPLFDVLLANNDADAYLRQAAAEGLVRATEQPCDLLNAWKNAGAKYDTPAVRLGLVLALRKLQCRRLGEFLNDADPRIVVEAARAIHDQNLMTPMADLAKLAEKPGLPDTVSIRALSANVKLGEPENAVRLAQFAARSGEPDHARTAALKLLADWAKPSRRDAVTGLAQVLPDRSSAVAATALKPALTKIFAGTDAVRKEAVQTVAKLSIKEVGPLMADIVADAKQPATTRVEALFALEALKANELQAAAATALAATEPKLRAAARVVTAKTNEAAAAKELPKLLDDPAATAVEKQMAFTALGGLKESKDADAAFAAWLDKLVTGSVPPELQLDLIEAATARSNSKTKLHAPLREKLKEYDAKVRLKAGMNVTLRYADALAGGDAEKGRDIFINNAAVYCQRCHKLDGQGGEVGPIMNGIGGQKTREYLLESITNPNAQIAQGFASVILTTTDGRQVSGVLKSKDKKNYVLVTAENKVLTIPADDVEGEKPDKSAMPEDLYKKLSKREMRDVVEFLATLKEPAKK